MYNSSEPSYKDELACYKCCVAEKGYAKEPCTKLYSNYGKGKNCDCEK